MLAFTLELLRALQQSDGKLIKTRSVGSCCANDHDNYGGGTVVAYDINYEDATLSCDACNKWIDPSYLDGKELITARFGTGEENE